MLTLFGPIKADVQESDLPYLKVKPQRKLSLTAQIVSAKVGGRSFRLKVKPVERDGEATWVEVVDFFQSRDSLRDSLAKLEERRLAQRERTALPVRSPDLPSFHATTVDISRTGLRLVTAGPVAIGVKVRLEIDAREPFTRPTAVSAITVWTSRRSDNAYQVGVRLLPEPSRN
jgi:hypothetical protein